MLSRALSHTHNNRQMSNGNNNAVVSLTQPMNPLQQYQVYERKDFEKDIPVDFESRRICIMVTITYMHHVRIQRHAQ